MGRLDAAVADYVRALAIEPENVWAHYNLGLVRLRQGRAVEAEASFSRCIDLVPSDARFLRARGLSRRGRGDFAGATRDYLAAQSLAAPDVTLEDVSAFESTRHAALLEMLSRKLESKAHVKSAAVAWISSTDGNKSSRVRARESEDDKEDANGVRGVAFYARGLSRVFCPAKTPVAGFLV
jgi:tetratricopeptide (TPR) repeat protein